MARRYGFTDRGRSLAFAVSRATYVEDAGGCVERVPDYDDESDLIGSAEPQCPCCGARTPVFLGSLGRREHYRCRACGITYSGDN